MGCGQSKIGIYQRKSKHKKNGGKRSESGEKEDETEDGEDTINGDNNKESGGGDGKEGDSDGIASKIKQMAQQQQQQQQTGGAVLAQSDISSSQLDFFKMLDEKIENGPDYEESDEEEQKARMANLVEEWKAACLARQQKKIESSEMEKWSLPGRGGKLFPEESENYPGKRGNVMSGQRFAPGYGLSTPSNNASVHFQNSTQFRVNPSSFKDQPRMQPRVPTIGNYHPYQPPSKCFNHCEPILTPEPLNPLRTNYPQVLLRQSSINSQLQHYPESQRLYPESIRQLADFSRAYQDPRPGYQMSRAVPALPQDHRMYGHDGNGRAGHQAEESQRMVVEVPRPYYDAHRPEIARPPFGNVENQMIYHERPFEKQRQFVADGARMHPEVPRASNSFQKPILTPRSIPDPSRVYREVENDETCFPRQERFAESGQEGSPLGAYNPGHFKVGRSLNLEVHYLAEPPPPREMIPLQGAPGPPPPPPPPQGSPRPMVARGLQTSVHRLPANSVVHFRKPQGAFT